MTTSKVYYEILASKSEPNLSVYISLLRFIFISQSFCLVAFATDLTSLQRVCTCLVFTNLSSFPARFQQQPQNTLDIESFQMFHAFCLCQVFFCSGCVHCSYQGSDKLFCVFFFCSEKKVWQFLLFLLCDKNKIKI